MDEADRGGKILLYACSVEHANVLANLLVVKGYKAAAVSSRTPPDRRRKVIAEYRDTDAIQILTNYDVLTTGFDAPRTNVAVITRPTRSVVLFSQMVGRAARGPKAGGNLNCRIITVIDQIPGYRSIAEGFGYWEGIWDERQQGVDPCRTRSSRSNSPSVQCVVPGIGTPRTPSPSLSITAFRRAKA